VTLLQYMQRVHWEKADETWCLYFDGVFAGSFSLAKRMERWLTFDKKDTCTSYHHTTFLAAKLAVESAAGIVVDARGSK
jgi:hypothetical protein